MTLSWDLESSRECLFVEDDVSIYTCWLPDDVGFSQLMMMMRFEEPCRSMGKDSSQYGRAVPQWPRVCHMLMMMMMVLLTNDSCHAFIEDVRIGW